jgi:hypothetical protein
MARSSEDEVHDELPFFHEENEHHGKLLDNRGDMLREAKKMKELRASLEDARNRVAELETQNLDAKLRFIHLWLHLWFLMRLIVLIALCT